MVENNITNSNNSLSYSSKSGSLNYNSNETNF